jgi:hypothetical protein
MPLLPSHAKIGAFPVEETEPGTEGNAPRSVTVMALAEPAVTANAEPVKSMAILLRSSLFISVIATLLFKVEYVTNVMHDLFGPTRGKPEHPARRRGEQPNRTWR